MRYWFGANANISNGILLEESKFPNNAITTMVNKQGIWRDKSKCP